jgi:anti-sigma regulatory factor (Ser/Thr protein kinase)
MLAPEFDLHLPADVSSVRTARHAIGEKLGRKVDEDTRMNAELLVSELVTNGVLHGSGADSWIDVHLRLDAGGLTIEVTDGGPGFDPDGLPTPDPTKPGGWGLTLVDRLADRWGTMRKRNGTAVWFHMNRVGA